MSKVKRLPTRNKVKLEDTWDLASLFANDAAWERGFKKLDKQIPKYAAFRGTLSASPKALAACLKFDADFDRLAERVGIYAFLRSAGDQTDNTCQTMMARVQNLGARAAQAASFIRPEILAMSAAKWKKMKAAPELKRFRLSLERLMRTKPHTLSDCEENLLAMQGEMAGAAGETFRKLLDADMQFGEVQNEKGERVELSNATFSQLLNSPTRSVRKTAFQQYYKQFQGHENTLAATLKGSILKDVYYARVRKHASSLDAALFPDNVPPAVYNNLIQTVRKHLPALHRYYDIRRRAMRLKNIRQYDTYVPILNELEVRRTWKQAVKLVLESVAPLGAEYQAVLSKGLNGRWCDRYPNRSKQSGAFSCGSFDGDPYIMMNYQPQVLNHVFTLAHEAGHSMHSYFSAKHQPFEYYNYTIFVAEVASTFNEQLLSERMLEQAKSDKERAYLINREIDDIRGTIFRQTMFAEFEKITHDMADAGQPLTVQSFQEVYQELLLAYFGPDFTLDDELKRECFRIPHFYRAFYVYKYATGMSAAIALAKRVLQGGKQELDEYLGFLRGGCSQDPLDLLRAAGVDMEQPEPVEAAMRHFEQLTAQLDELL